MRLINTETLRLESFMGSRPGYAILSHTWEQDELLFEDVHRSSANIPEKHGFAKFIDRCRRAREDGYRYIWIDTCCIDKSSSAELSEAINSMFEWYSDAKVCYAYLSDVTVGSPWMFERSRWFTRGWTLQELIAPDQVEFYDRNWNKIGERKAMVEALASITGIHKKVLSRRGLVDCDHLLVLTTETSRKCLECNTDLSIRKILSTYSIATRMGWSADRVTTREEDIAYCLMGPFNLNMPLLYGEGGKAFTRLQEELIKASPDQSILAHMQPGWAANPAETDASCPVLATSTSSFRHPYQIQPGNGTSSMSVNNQGITVSVLICPCIREYNIKRSLDPASYEKHLWLGILDCSVDGNFLSRPAILLEATTADNKTFRRVDGSMLLKLTPRDVLTDSSKGEIEMSRSESLHHKIIFDPRQAKQEIICLQSGYSSDDLEMIPPLRLIHKIDRSYRYRPVASYPEFSRSIHTDPTKGVEYNLPRISSLGGSDFCGIIYFATVALGHAVSLKSSVFIVWGLRWEAHVQTTEASKSATAGDKTDTPVTRTIRKLENTYITQEVYHSRNGRDPERPWCSIVQWDTGLSGMDPEVLQSRITELQRGTGPFLSLLPPPSKRLATDVKEIIADDLKINIAAEIRPCSFLGREFFELQVATERTKA